MAMARDCCWRSRTPLRPTTNAPARHYRFAHEPVQRSLRHPGRHHDYQFPNEMAPLRRSGNRWSPGEALPLAALRDKSRGKSAELVRGETRRAIASRRSATPEEDNKASNSFGPKNLCNHHRDAVSRRGDNASAADHLWMAGGDRRPEHSVLGELAGRSRGRYPRILRLCPEAVVPCELGLDRLSRQTDRYRD